MPRDELILFTPGPVRIPPSVAHALSHPRCNYHRQDAFRDMFKETEVLLKQLIGIKNADDYYATVMTGTGTGANEACLLAFEPLGKGLIVDNGFFAARAIDQAKQNNIAVETLPLPNDLPIDVKAVETVLDRDPSIKWVFFVSHETRAGLRNPLEQLGRSIKQRGRMLAVDVISSAFAYPIDLEAAQVDLATASSAKAIMAAPGLGVIFTRKAAVPVLEAAAGGKPRGYYLDVVAEYHKQVNEAQTRFAQPVCLHAALHAACTHLAEIGIERHYQRVQDQMSALIEHLAKLGSQPLLADGFRSNIAVNFRLPVGTPYTRFSKQMEELGFFCLYGIPGDQSHFQLSTIGDLTDAHIDGMKSALSEVLKR